MQYERLSEIKDKDYKIVSLGFNCFPRTILTRWGLKPSKAQGELSMPFDFAVYETFEITKCLEEQFGSFFENLEFYSNKFLPWRKKFWYKSPDLIKFVHEKSLGKNDKSKLITIYSRRIENFKKCIEDKTPILFVQLVGDCEDIENVYKELTKFRGDKTFRLLVIDPDGIIKSDNKNIIVLKLAYPSKLYKHFWWSKKFFWSAKDIKFERQIADTCVEIIKALP